MSENKTTSKKTAAAVAEMNIYQRMAKITNELQTVAKNLVVEITKSNSYKAVSERDIIDAVKPVELENGVYSYPVSREVLESHILESEKVWNGQATKTTSFFSRIKTIYRFVNVDKPEEYIETTVFSEGIDSQDKGSGKAMTYADKYALMKAYKISTGEDPDQTGSTEENYTKKYNPNDTKHKCEDCGKIIAPTQTNRGEIWTADDIAGYSFKRYGRKLCPSCQKKAADSQ
jgi:ribosomal protein L34E